MALPDPPNSISISQINTQLGTSGQSKLSEREGLAMTGGLGPTYDQYAHGDAGICLPLEGQRTVTYPNPPTATSVFYNGGLVPWRPSAMSEFRSGYGSKGATGAGSNKPYFTGFTIGTTGHTSTGTVTLTFDKGQKANIVYVTIVGSNGSVPLAWTATAATSYGPVTISRSTIVPTYTAYIQDQWGCGGNLEFSITGITYP